MTRTKKFWLPPLFGAIAIGALSEAQANKNEPLIQADFETITTSGRVSYHPRIREASACITNAKGEKFTLTIDFVVAASIQDLGIKVDKSMPAQDASRLIVEKFPPALADKAAAYIDQVWKKIASRHRIEEITSPPASPEFLKDFQQTFADMADGKRLQPDVKSFEEETGITIAAGAIMPGKQTPGCSP